MTNAVPETTTVPPGVILGEPEPAPALPAPSVVRMATAGNPPV